MVKPLPPWKAKCMFCGDTGEVFKRRLAHKLAVTVDSELDREADAIITALESVVLSYNLNEIPRDPDKAVDFGVELLDIALRRYADALRKGEVRQ